MPLEHLDTFDIALLRELQADTRQTSEQLGEKVGLSSTACQRRLKKFREAGVIDAEIAVLSPEILGRRITIIVQVILSQARLDLVDEFRRRVRAIPEVQQCYYVTGEYDFIIVATVEDLSQYEQLTHQVFFENPIIQKFNSSIVTERVKVGLQIPL